MKNPNRIPIIVTILFSLIHTSMHAAEPVRSSPNKKPNILFVLVDDMGFGDLAANGGANVPTPAMDKIAADGMRFTQFYTASPICSASRCGLITGQFPARWRITSFLQTRDGNKLCDQADFLDPAAPSYVRAFHQAGYATAHVGKWHLGGGRDVTDAPKFAAYGYDLGLGTYESPEPAAALGLKSLPWAAQTEPQQVKRHDRTRWMVDQSLAFVKQSGDKPWLINLWFDDVHTPHTPSDAQKKIAGDGVGTAAFRAVLKDTDREIGRLMDGLRDMGVDKNTLVIIAGDNGPQPSFNRARTAGMRGMKWSLYEGGIRTPLVFSWPGNIAKSVNDDTVISAVDFVPTLCALAGISAPTNVVFDGEDLSAAMHGEKHLRSKPLFWTYGTDTAPAAGTKIQGFPAPAEPDSKSPPLAMRDGDWKLLTNSDGTMVELYNLATDRNESKNIAADNPDQVKKLQSQLSIWLKSLPAKSADSPTNANRSN